MAGYCYDGSRQAQHKFTTWDDLMECLKQYNAEDLKYL